MFYGTDPWRLKQMHQKTFFSVLRCSFSLMLTCHIFAREHETKSYDANREGFKNDLSLIFLF